ncbi:MAG: murein tripeptide amidase MpaA [Myxococcota bacterium]
MLWGAGDQEAPVHISAAFDSGNIEVLDASDPTQVKLAIRKDAGDEHMQWFHFRVAGARGLPCTFRLTNAHAASYPKAWTGYRAVCTSDRKTFSRVQTAYEDGALVIRHTPTSDLVWYSYFAPYSLEQHHDLLARCQASPFARVDRLGATADGRDLDRVTVGTGERQLWVIARQHPGESMAEWWMEGFLARLLDPADALARSLRAAATFHVVPNMNPDGSVRGHLRCNATGANLNREWHAPTLERSPEVLHVLREMEATGCDLCLDVHGDEELPYNFISGGEGIPGWSARLARLDAVFRAEYVRANPDFQIEHGYPIDAPGSANLSMCTNAVAQRFDCLAMTLEMPFKDNANAPDRHHGWCPQRSKRLGASSLDPMAAVVHTLR